ncbi:MAG: response regulator [Deltaproteobacteria bacterium]|nr:response regulator [Deltaproteobacteria bacterium]
MHDFLTGILHLRFTPWSLPHLGMLMLMVALLVNTKRRMPNTPLVRSYRLMVGAALIWTLLEGIQISTISPEAQSFWMRLQAIGFAATGPLWLVFTTRLSGGNLTKSRAIRFVLWLVYLASLAIVWTNPIHHQFAGKHPSSLGGGLFWALVTTQLGLVAIGYASIIGSFLKHESMRNTHDPLILLLAAVPPAGYILLVPSGLLPTSLTGPVTAAYAAILYLVLRGHQPSLKAPLSLPVLLNTIDALLAATTVDGTIVEINDKVDDIFNGRLVPNGRPRTIAELLTHMEPATPPPEWSTLQHLDTKRSRKPVRFSCPLGGPEGLWASIALHPLHLGRQLYGYLLHIQDITQVATMAQDLQQRDQELRQAHQELERAHRKLAARAEDLERAVAAKAAALEEQHQQLLHAQKMESLGALAGGIAHDFNNVLFSLIGYADLILEDPQNPDEVGYCAAKIKASSQRAAELTRKLLGFARRDKPHLQAMDLSSLIRDVVDLLRRTVEPRIQFRYSIESSQSRIMGDPQQIHQVLMNLCLNAAEAISGAGQVTVSTEGPVVGADLQSGQSGIAQATWYLLLTVTDTGCGMSEETVAHVFEPFFTTKSRGKGTGLGLSLVYGIVKEHGGFIDVTSTPGKGSRFRIYLPIKPGASHDDGPQVDKPSTERGSRRKRPAFKTFDHLSLEQPRVGILVIDDNPDVLALTKRYFAEPIFEVTTAQNAAEGQAILADSKQHLDVVLLDLILPDGDPIDIFTQIKAIKPGIPIVIMSGYHDDDRLSELMVIGAAKFLKKPFSRKDLRATVRHILEE